MPRVTAGPTATIRLATDADRALILAADVFDGPAELLSTRRFLGAAGQDAPHNILLLAEAGGRVIGFASGTILDHPDKPRALFVQELGVNEDWQRQGIARALIGALRAEGRARGCAVTWVLTEAGNAPARAAYAGSGGKETTGIVMYDWDEAKDT